MVLFGTLCPLIVHPVQLYLEKAVLFLWNGLVDRLVNGFVKWSSKKFVQLSARLGLLDFVRVVKVKQSGLSRVATPDLHLAASTLTSFLHRDCPFIVRQNAGADAVI